MTPANRRRLVTGLLALIAGLCDCLGWVLLKGAFTAHITGNLVVSTADTVRGHAPASAALLAIPVFVLATAAATVLSLRLSQPLAVQRWLLGGQTALLVVTAVIAAAGSVPVLPVLLPAVCAMAVQNAFLHLRLAPAPSTAVMTGNVVAATIALVRFAAVRGDRPAAKAAFANAWPLIAGFLAGCVIAGGAAATLDAGAWLVPATVSLGTTAWLWNRAASEAGEHPATAPGSEPISTKGN